MTKTKSSLQGYMTIGEVAKKMGITVRTLQYYDKEGLLRPSKESIGGRRLYTYKEIVKLHQIVSLKSLGFSLKEIKNKLTKLDTPDEVAETLTQQAEILRKKINNLSEVLQQLELLKIEVLQIKKVDFQRYADIIMNLQMKNDAYYLIKYFDEGTLDYFRNKFDKEKGKAFLNHLNVLRDKATQYHNENINPNSQQGQALAKAFWEMINEFTDKDMNILSQLLQMGNIDKDISALNQKERIVNDFLESALKTYLEQLNFNITEVK